MKLMVFVVYPKQYQVVGIFCSLNVRYIAIYCSIICGIIITRGARIFSFLQSLELMTATTFVGDTAIHRTSDVMVDHLNGSKRSYQSIDPDVPGVYRRSGHGGMREANSANVNDHSSSSISSHAT